MSPLSRRSFSAILAGGLLAVGRPQRVPVRVVPKKGFVDRHHVSVIRADSGEDMGPIPLALNPPFPWTPGQQFDIVRWEYPLRKVWGRSLATVPVIPVVVVA
jgi:hypothetical protein